VAECTLIIQASQVSIENIERQLESLLKKVVSEDFCIAATSRIAPFKSDYIPTIAQMTNTFIEAVDDNTVSFFFPSIIRDPDFFDFFFSFEFLDWNRRWEQSTMQKGFYSLPSE
jgi:hypothetical protein